MYPFFPKPDRVFKRCGDLDCAVVERAVAGAPGFMRGLRALFASDMHVLRRTTREQLAALAGRIADTRPDIILLGGDYSDEAPQAERLFEAFRGLDAPLGVYGVLGNNDREAWPDVDALRQRMARAGVTLLVNESRAISVNGGTLWVAGADESFWGRPDVRGLYPPAPAPDAWRLLLFHEPKPVSPAPDMMLCGHTHGGQFNVLGVTPYFIGFERLFGRRVHPLAVSGLREIDGMKLLVSKGIGASRIQLRVGVRPEIELVTFQ